MVEYAIMIMVELFNHKIINFKGDQNNDKETIFI